MAVKTYIAAKDTFVNEAQPTATFGQQTFLRMRQDSGFIRRSFVYFPVSTDLAGANIVSATLRVRLYSAWSSANIAVRRCTEVWSEGATWDVQPAVTDNGMVTETSITGDDEAIVNIDVRQIVQAWANGVANRGLRLNTNVTTLRAIYSSEAAGVLKPRLIVEYVNKPSTPTNLVPRGGTAIAEAQPRFRWDGPQPSQVQVQMALTDSFSSPNYDSMFQVCTETEFDTADYPAPPSIPDDATRYWRVRYQDGFGGTSEWSNSAEFQRRTYASLAITNPGATVNSTTPNITHTFTGRSQTAVAYELLENNATVWTFPKHATLQTTFRLLPGYIRQPAPTTYTIVVRVWDQFDRLGQGYVEAEQTFSFAAGAVTAPTNLAVSTQGGHVRLTWTRGTTPTYFALVEDGVIVEDRIDPEEASTGGTGYAFNWYGSAPRTEHIYQVQAIVETSGIPVHSPSSSGVTFSYDLTGIWLMDPETGQEVNIQGQDEITATIGESGATFAPIGRRSPVRVVDQIRGYEGTVSGTLITVGNRTAQAEREAFERIKARQGLMRLAYARRNIPVVLGESSLEADPLEEEIYGISFEYWQSGGEFDIGEE